MVARFKKRYTKYDWVYWPFGRFKGQGRTWPRAGMVDSLDLKSSGIYSRGGSSPPEATIFVIK